MTVEGTLFGETAVTPGPLIPTNRFNLLEILSSRVVSPRAAYVKYYADLLELADGRVPVVRGPFGDDVVAAVSSESAAAYPVALELDPAALSEIDVEAWTGE